jgi:hypothetical protein
MKWELDDNARSGFHYLALGALTIGAVVLASWILDRIYPGIGPGGAFSHGYLVHDDGMRMIVATTSRGERIVTVVSLAFGAALLAGMVTVGIALAFRRAYGPAARIAMKVAFLLTVCCLGYSALFLPPREFMGEREGAFTVRDRHVLFNEVVWLGAAIEEVIPIESVQQIHINEPIGSYHDTFTIELVLKNGRSERIGLGDDYYTDTRDVSTFAKDRVHSLRMKIAPK